MKARRDLFLLALALLPLLVYLPNLGHELIWDSKPIIRENELLQSEFSLLAPFRSGYWATTSQRGSRYDYYRPLTILSFMAEKAAWGLSPWRLRFINLLIFIAALFALYAFLLRQNAPAGVAETAALLFALFPLHADNINWVVGRCDLLMLLFGILSLLLFDRFLEKPRPRLGALILGCYALALFSKEGALFFLPLFPLHELFRRRRLTLPFHLPLLLVTLAFWLLKSLVIGRAGFPLRPFPTLWGNVQPVLGALGYYARSLFFPYRYDMFLPVTAVQTPAYLVAGGGFILLLVLLLLWGRKWGALFGTWLWIAPSLAGSLLLLFTPIHPFSLSSRYLLVPAIGWTWLLSHGLARLRPALKHAALAALLVAGAATVSAHAQHYRSEGDFWQSAFRSCPHDSFFISKYARELRAKGDFVRSEVLLRRALAYTMKPATAIAIALQLADGAFARARYAESLDWLDKLAFLELDPANAEQRRQRILKILVARNDLAAAEAALQEAVVSPAGLQAPESRMALYMDFAAWDKARAEAQALPFPRGASWLETIQKQEAQFLALAPEQQCAYFIDRGNFAAAWELWPGKDAPGISERLQAARLAFLAGCEEEGMRRIQRLLDEHGKDFKVLNSAGDLFFALQRADEALDSYRRSLRAKPDQPALRARISFLDPRRR